VALGAVVATAGLIASFLLFLAASLATTSLDALGFVVLAFGFTVVPWAGVLATWRRWWGLAAAGFVVAAVGFAALARDGFPAIPPAILSLAVALAAGWRAVARINNAEVTRRGRRNRTTRVR